MPAVGGQVVRIRRRYALQVIDVAAPAQEPLDHGFQQVLGVRPAPGKSYRRVQQMIAALGQQLVRTAGVRPTRPGRPGWRGVPRHHLPCYPPGTAIETKICLRRERCPAPLPARRATRTGRQLQARPPRSAHHGRHGHRKLCRASRSGPTASRWSHADRPERLVQLPSLLRPQPADRDNHDPGKAPAVSPVSRARNLSALEVTATATSKPTPEWTPVWG